MAVSVLAAPPCMVPVSVPVPAAELSLFRLSPPQPAINATVRDPKSQGAHLILSPLLFAGRLTSTPPQPHLASVGQVQTSGRDGSPASASPSLRSRRSSSRVRRRS